MSAEAGSPRRDQDWQRLIVGINLGESRTRNFTSELLRRGYAVEEFRVARASDLLETARLVRALSRAAFVLMGPSIPWGLCATYLARLFRRAVVLDCPMDITEWPFAPAAHARKIARILIRSASRVVTLETRDYFREKFGLQPGTLVTVESCPDEQMLREAIQAQTRFVHPPGSFVICCSGGAVHHRLERFLPIFERLAPMVPQVILLIIADPGQPLSMAASELARRARLEHRIVLSPVIRPAPDFFATLTQVDLWIATLGDDTLQGDREFRMELLEVARLGIPVASVRTSALAHHRLEDGQTIAYFDPADPEVAAGRLASLVRRPETLRQLSVNLKAYVTERFILTRGVDAILNALPSRRSKA